jgi:hypothetical protein
MIVDVIRKSSLDESSNLSSSTKLSVRIATLLGFTSKRCNANQRIVIEGLTGLDSLIVCIKEIVIANNWQINQHDSAIFKESCLVRSPGCVIPGFNLS